MRSYSDLVQSFAMNPRDIHTIPMQAGRQPVWFYAFVENQAIYVEPAKNHTPKSMIAAPRKLNKSQFPAMLELHHRRKQGEAVSSEAARTTVNQVYWYGIFDDLNL